MQPNRASNSDSQSFARALNGDPTTHRQGSNEEVTGRQGNTNISCGADSRQGLPQGPKAGLPEPRSVGKSLQRQLAH